MGAALPGLAVGMALGFADGCGRVGCVGLADVVGRTVGDLELFWITVLDGFIVGKKVGDAEVG